MVITVEATVGVKLVDWCCCGCRTPCFNLHLGDHFDDTRSSNIGRKIEAFPSHFRKWNGIRVCRRCGGCRVDVGVVGVVVIVGCCSSCRTLCLDII